MNQTPLPNWDQWQSLSRQYLDAWQNMARGGAGLTGAGLKTAAGDVPSATAGFEQWARMFGAGGAQGETIERIVDSAKGYATFMQSMFGAMANEPMPSAMVTPTMPSFAMPGFDAGLDNPALRAWRDAQGQVQQTFAQAIAAMSAMRPPLADQSDAAIELKSWLNLPAFGLMREQQEHHQQAATALVDYQQQMSRYNALMLKASQRGFELFQGKLATREEPGRQVDSLRGLYDLWVDAAEEGYAEIALSIEFREAYAALVNAQMRVRANVQKDAERIATDLGLPTRSEINSIGERLQALRRDVRQSKAQGDDADVRRELARLRRDFEALRKDSKRADPAPKARVVDADSASGGDDDAAGDDDRRQSSKKRVKSRVKADTRKAAARPDKGRKRSTRKAAQSDVRAVAAAAPGTFASRIARFADASLGSSRTRTGKAEKSAKTRKKR